MQPSRPGQTRVERRFEDAERFAQPPLRVLDSECLEKILGGRARPTVEEAVKMGFTQSHDCRQFLQARLVRMVLVQIADHGRDALEIIHTGILAGCNLPDTRFLLRFKTVKELLALAATRARHAGGPRRLPNLAGGVGCFMKTLPVATFDDPALAEQLRTQFSQAGLNSILHDESKLERFWFMSEPLAAIHVEVAQPDYLRARRLMSEWEKSTDLLRAAVRCPECQSSCIEFPQITRKFLTPALCHILLTILHIVPRKFYCLDCHFTWPKVPRVEPQLDILGFPVNSRF